MGNNSRKKREEWTKPVSRKFYDGLKTHIAECLKEMRECSGWLNTIMGHVDRYLDKGTKPSFSSIYINPIEIHIFTFIRRDIDIAMRRSAMARERAARRRAAREAEKATSAPDRIGKESAVEQRATESDLVGILDLVADGNTAGKLSDAHTVIGSQPAVKIEIGGLPLHGRTESQNYFTDLTGSHAIDKRVNLQLIGTDTVHRRDNSAEHMVEPRILAGVLETHHVLDTLDNANRRTVTAGVGADRTDLGLRDVMAERTVAHPAAHIDNSLTQRDTGRLIAAENVEREAQSRLTADARQTRKLRDGTFEKF